MYSYGSPHTAAQKQDDQHERTFSSYVRIQVVVLKTCLGRWTIGRSGERGSGISVLPARYDDDDDDDIWTIIKRLKWKYFYILVHINESYTLKNYDYLKYPQNIKSFFLPTMMDMTQRANKKTTFLFMMFFWKKNRILLMLFVRK